MDIKSKNRSYIIVGLQLKALGSIWGLLLQATYKRIFKLELMSNTHSTSQHHAITQHFYTGRNVPQV